jgi:hypothetical protein
MLLRTITSHVKEQNWFAVLVDFLIVVLGILIAFQITEWNEQQQASKREQLVLVQLQEEFTDIKAAIEKQNAIRSGYIESLRQLIATLEGVEPADDLTLKTALDAARSTGRRPAQSAAYLQLMASGELTNLSSEALQQTLIGYDALLQRDAFIFPELMREVAEEISTNPFVDYNINSLGVGGAAIDRDVSNQDSMDAIRSYDLAGLRGLEPRYEFIFLIHVTILDSDSKLLELVDQILLQIQRSQ